MQNEEKLYKTLIRLWTEIASNFAKVFIKLPAIFSFHENSKTFCSTTEFYFCLAFSCLLLGEKEESQQFPTLFGIEFKLKARNKWKKLSSA